MLKLFPVSGEIYSKQKIAASVQVFREILKGLKQVHLAKLRNNNTRLILGKRRKSLIRKMLAIIGQSQSDSSATWMQSQIHFIYCFYFIYLWLPWVFVAARRLSLVAMSGDYSSLWYGGFSFPWLLLSQSMGSAVVVHRLRWPVLCGIFPDEGSNSCSLHWQVDS